MTIELDPQSGTGQVEDSLLICIPNTSSNTCTKDSCKESAKRNSKELTRKSNFATDNFVTKDRPRLGDFVIIKKLNSASQWPHHTLIIPGNRIEFSLQTASNYVKDNKANRFGFKSLVIGYEDISQEKISKFCLAHLEYELAYLGGMCSAILMKKDSIYADDVYDDYNDAENTLQKHSTLLSNGLLASDGLETINNIFDSHILVG